MNSMQFLIWESIFKVNFFPLYLKTSIFFFFFFLILIAYLNIEMFKGTRFFNEEKKKVAKDKTEVLNILSDMHSIDFYSPLELNVNS